MESRLISVLAKSFRKFLFKSSGLASSVISIFLSKSKYFKTSSIKDLISSTERIEGVPPPKYNDERVLFSNSSFRRKISFFMAEIISSFNLKEVEK